MDCIENQPGREGSPYLFPADVGDGHFIGVVRVLDRVCAKAKLTGVTPYVLRHIFASVAGDLGFSEPTIAGWFGHAARGVTHGYVHLDTALVVAADQVSAEIARRRGEGWSESGWGRLGRSVGRCKDAGGISKIGCRWRPGVCR